MFPKIRELSKNVTVYGLGDVAVSIVNFLLLFRILSSHSILIFKKVVYFFHFLSRRKSTAN